MKRLKVIVLSSLFLASVSCSSSDDDNGGSCEDRILASADAAVALSEATNDNYTELCNAYRSALQLQIQACGDEGGSIQALIDALEDCSTNSTSENN